ncbi:topoisomerase C-terminal repeat-containing protein [Caulobacter sp. UC70_42]|uniref:topoisomerase C-terminal repeat-containing protein n=1 Tax=Caulobacter sp. UC70_42 TaxID=3374551 RepID=UPI0037563894
MDLEKALRLLSLPREVGKHPDDGKVITAGLGRFGPFVLHDGTYANLENPEEVFDVGLNRAVAILADKRAGGGRPQRGAATALAEIGNHPEDGKPVRVLSGRFGPYIKHGDTNANVPKGKDPASITMDEAVALIAERAAKGGGKKPAKKAARRRPRPRRKATLRPRRPLRRSRRPRSRLLKRPRRKPRPRRPPRTAPPPGTTKPSLFRGSGGE